jgi:hypothetical protein
VDRAAKSTTGCGDCAKEVQGFQDLVFVYMAGYYQGF